ncbi:MAG: hypothetical protein ACM3PR_13265, partial [Bacteroidales bacterium]
MKRYIILLALSVVFLISIVAQNPKSNKTQNAKQDKTKPKEDIRVNREYDEKGNLIKFDSVYSYSYSSDSTLKDFDFKNFSDPFEMNSKLFNDSVFSQFFMKDFDLHFPDSFMQNRDSMISKLNKMHNLHFKNDSLAHNPMDMDEFFQQFQQFQGDSSSTMQPFFHEFNFDSKGMKEMMEQMQKQMEQFQSHQQG